jgi:hypothetical protein
MDRYVKPTLVLPGFGMPTKLNGFKVIHNKKTIIVYKENQATTIEFNYEPYIKLEPGYLFVMNGNHEVELYDLQGKLLFLI